MNRSVGFEKLIEELSEKVKTKHAELQDLHASLLKQMAQVEAESNMLSTAIAKMKETEKPKMQNLFTPAELVQLEKMKTTYFEEPSDTKDSKLPDSETQAAVYQLENGSWGCSLCDKTFTTKGSAKRHISVHRADKYKCPKCSSKFTRRDDLYNHLRRVHSAEDIVETMKLEHKAERHLRGVFITVKTHDEHVDLVLPSGSHICRKKLVRNTCSHSEESSGGPCSSSCPPTKRNHIGDPNHFHSETCGHPQIKHDDHFDFLVGNKIDSEHGNCDLHGCSLQFEDNDLLALSDFMASPSNE